MYRLYEKVLHRVNACVIQKSYTKRMQRTVHPWSIRGVSIKAYKTQQSSNPFGDTTIKDTTRLVEKKRDGKKSLHRLI